MNMVQSWKWFGCRRGTVSSKTADKVFTTPENQSPDLIRRIQMIAASVITCFMLIHDKSEAKGTHMD